MSVEPTRARLLKDYPADQVGAWEISGEDPNCDLGGHHSNPHLGSYVGKYRDAVERALKTSGFFTWGYGGYVRPTKLAVESAVLSDEELKLIVELRAQKKKWTPMSVKDYSREEKQKRFDELHAFALAELEHAKQTGRSQKDVEQYAFELVMKLLGPSVFNAYNEYLR